MLLGRVKAVHEVHGLEEHLLVFDVDLSAHLKKPINDSRAQLASDLDLISEQGIELCLVLVLKHVVEKLPPVLLQVGRLLEREHRPVAATYERLV